MGGRFRDHECHQLLLQLGNNSLNHNNKYLTTQWPLSQLFMSSMDGAIFHCFPHYHFKIYVIISLNLYIFFSIACAMPILLIFFPWKRILIIMYIFIQLQMIQQPNVYNIYYALLPNPIFTHTYTYPLYWFHFFFLQYCQ